MAIRMQQRRGTSEQWTTANPVLAPGEIGWESDTNKFKMGDGVNQWADLDYFLNESQLEGSIDDFIPLTQKGAADGVAELDSTGKVPSSQLPDIDELSQDAVNNALTAGTGITKDYNDGANTITLAVDTNVIATQTYVDTAVGNVDLSGKQDVVAGVSSTEIGYLDGVTSAIQTQLDSKAASSHTHSLADVTDVTASAAEVNLLDGVTASTTEINYLDGVTSGIQTQLDNKAPLSSPSFTGTVSGITASMVGLGNVDNTSDTDKPISTATQTALDGKLSLSGGTMTGDLTLVGAPTQANHAATKAYADSIAEGLHIHPSCVAATSANVSISTDLEVGDVVDGVTLAEGDRVLVKSQTNAAQNGIYVVQASGAALRAADFNEPQEVDGGDFVFVTGGTLYDNTGWVQTTTNVVTIGTDPITFTQFSGAGTYIAGTGIEITGNEIAVDFADVAAASHTHNLADVTDVTATAAEVNVLDGITASTAELNILDGVTATASELNILDGATLSTTELNYVDGVTSAIQTQLDGKASTSHTHTLDDLSDVSTSGATNGQVLSFNGSSWEAAAVSGGGGSITSNPSRMAYASGTGRHSSFSGTTWDTSSGGSNEYYTNVFYSQNGFFYSQDYSNGNILYSSDGKNWTSIPNPISGTLIDVYSYESTAATSSGQAEERTELIFMDNLSGVSSYLRTFNGTSFSVISHSFSAKTYGAAGVLDGMVNADGYFNPTRYYIYCDSYTAAGEGEGEGEGEGLPLNIELRQQDGTYNTISPSNVSIFTMFDLQRGHATNGKILLAAVGGTSAGYTQMIKVYFNGTSWEAVEIPQNTYTTADGFTETLLWGGAITYGNGKFYAIGKYWLGSDYYYIGESLDGTTWEWRSISSTFYNRPITHMTYINGWIYIIASSTVYRSKDLVSWSFVNVVSTESGYSQNYYYRPIAYGQPKDSISIELNDSDPINRVGPGLSDLLRMI